MAATRRGPGGWQRGLTTDQRGLGHQHQKARRRLLAALKDGDPCARCLSQGVFHPMYCAWPHLLEVDDFPPRVIARAMGIEPVKSLSWKRCNRSAGGRLGNAIKAARRLPKPSDYTRW